MATHSSILAWRIPQTEEPGGLCSPWDCKGSDATEHAHTPKTVDHISKLAFKKNIKKLSVMKR